MGALDKRPRAISPLPSRRPSASLDSASDVGPPSRRPAAYLVEGKSAHAPRRLQLGRSTPERTHSPPPSGTPHASHARLLVKHVHGPPAYPRAGPRASADAPISAPVPVPDPLAPQTLLLLVLACLALVLVFAFCSSFRLADFGLSGATDNAAAPVVMHGP